MTSSLNVAWWCERSIVSVPADDVRAGRTESCRRVGCEPPPPTERPLVEQEER